MHLLEARSKESYDDRLGRSFSASGTSGATACTLARGLGTLANHKSTRMSHERNVLESTSRCHDLASLSGQVEPVKPPNPETFQLAEAPQS